MRRCFKVLLALSTAAVTAPAWSGPANAAPGTLYPPATAAMARPDLVRALGPAGYILSDMGQDEGFRAGVSRAVAVHPVFHAQASQGALTRADLRAARSGYLPRLSANLNGDYVLARDFGPDTDNIVEALRPRGQVNAGLSVSQLLFDGGATASRVRSAKARNTEAERSIDARVNELTLAALSAHYDLAAHQAIVALGAEFIRRHEALLKNVIERERLGAGSRADVMRASARLAAARARVSQIRESERLAEIRYAEFFKDTPAALKLPSFEAIAVNSRDAAATLALQNHPDVAIATARVDAAQADYSAAKAQRLPELRARVGAVKFDVFDGGADYDVRGGVSMNYDLYSGGERGAAISRAAEAARQNAFDQDRIRQELARDAAIAFERRAAAIERLEALGDALVANHGARDLISERFRASRGEIIDILQAENDWFEAGVGYLAGLADRDLATYELMEFTGDLLRFFAPGARGTTGPVLGSDDDSG